MSTKTADQAMDYEVAGSKKLNKSSVVIKAAESVSTSRLVWILVKRHKVALLAIGNVILVLNWALPEWPEFVKSLF